MELFTYLFAGIAAVMVLFACVQTVSESKAISRLVDSLDQE